MTFLLLFLLLVPRIISSNRSHIVKLPLSRVRGLAGLQVGYGMEGGMWDMGYGMWDGGYVRWDIGYGMWGVGHGLWDVGYGMWDEGYGMQSKVWDIRHRMKDIGYGMWEGDRDAGCRL